MQSNLRVSTFLIVNFQGILRCQEVLCCYRMSFLLQSRKTSTGGNITASLSSVAFFDVGKVVYPTVIASRWSDFEAAAINITRPLSKWSLPWMHWFGESCLFCYRFQRNFSTCTFYFPQIIVSGMIMVTSDLVEMAAFKNNVICR